MTTNSKATPAFFPALVELPLSMWRYRNVLRATTMLELNQKYAGSLLGSFWIILYPLLFLGIYLFLYLVIFKMRFPGFSELNYVAFVFTGLVPYLMLMEAIGRGAVIVRENMHLLRNMIMPAELVVVRLVFVAMIAQTASFVILFLLIAIDGDLTWRTIFLPLVFLFTALFIMGIVFIVAALGAIFPDVSYMVNLLLLFVLFLSPIAFKPEMVPTRLLIIVDVNPITYILEGFRWALLGSYQASMVKLAIFPVISIASYLAGTAFFRRFKGLMVDHA